VDRHSLGTKIFDHHGSGPKHRRVVLVRSYKDVVEAYTVHPEAKSLAPDGRPCRRSTVGLLSRRPVQASGIHYIGKESNRLEDVEAGTVHRLRDVLSEYHDPDQDPFDLYVIPILAEVPARVLAESAGMHPRKVAAIRNGHARPRRVHQAALTNCAAEFARERLREAGFKAPRTDASACHAYVILRGSEGPP
jgi:hypothetical protein